LAKAKTVIPKGGVAGWGGNLELLIESAESFGSLSAHLVMVLC